MAKSPQWNVKGVDDATRVVARDAAAAAGLPIGSWIDRAVRRAAALPQDVPAEAPAAAEPARPVAPLRVVVRNEDREDIPEPAAPGTRSPAVGGASEMPAEIFPRSARNRGLGYGARAAIAVGIMTLLTGGGLWLLSEMMRPPSIAPRTETAPQASVAARAPEPGTPASDPAAQKISAPAAGATTPPPVSEVEALRQAAQAGDARAQYDLGIRYASGRDIAKDDAAAAQWFERAAVQGLASAQYNLGVMYDRGLGVKEDPTLAFFWYQSAAEQGHARAEHNLATAYADGKGTNADLAQAAKWFEKAAAAGVPESQYYLGVMYERGMGVPKDLDRAMAMFRLAAGQGHKEAAEKIAALGATASAPAAPAVPAATTAEPGLPRATLAEIQQLLSRLDFDPGPADGRMGKKTEEAIAKYQAMAGMAADGKPSAALLDDLRAVAGAAKR